MHKVAVLVAAAPAAGVSGAPSAQAFRVRVFRFVDHSRTVRLPSGARVPRSLDTVVRFPATGGPFPLIVFGHGYALTPHTYARLLSSWANAHYVVAAPEFPLERRDAPGGPDESDIVNQPRDMSYVIGRLLGLKALAGQIDAGRIAVAGHSDGAETALAVAYDPRFRDARVRAAIVLSGAALPGMRGFPRHGPPLLAIQGTADPINSPRTTAAFFGLAARPKFLLWLVGASHLPPYTTEQPQLGIVERVTAAFLDHYLKGRPLGALAVAARAAELTRLTADP